MQVGQKIEIHEKGRKHGVLIGVIEIVEQRYIVVRFKNYRESFLRVDVEYNIERNFCILGGDRNEPTKKVG